MRTKIYTNWAQVPVVMNLQTACMILGRGYDALKKDAREGKFPAFKNGEKLWAVKKDDLLEYIEKQKTA
ncbi:MAG: DNA-binding protein [Clostridium sp.]|jgi:predicted site-specific integrase-resolvase